MRKLDEEGCLVHGTCLIVSFLNCARREKENGDHYDNRAFHDPATSVVRVDVGYIMRRKDILVGAGRVHGALEIGVVRRIVEVAQTERVPYLMNGEASASVRILGKHVRQVESC